MYIMNGVCYAGESGNDSKITAVKALDGMMLLLTFEGGEKRLFDAHELTGPAFDPYNGGKKELRWREAFHTTS